LLPSVAAAQIVFVGVAPLLKLFVPKLTAMPESEVHEAPLSVDVYTPLLNEYNTDPTATIAPVTLNVSGYVIDEVLQDDPLVV
jgi:hypothetical protein